MARPAVVARRVGEDGRVRHVVRLAQLDDDLVGELGEIDKVDLSVRIEVAADDFQHLVDSEQRRARADRRDVDGRDHAVVWGLPTARARSTQEDRRSPG